MPCKDTACPYTLNMLWIVIISDSIRQSLMRKYIFKFLTKGLISSFHIHQELSCSSLAQFPYESNQTNSQLISNHRCKLFTIFVISIYYIFTYSAACTGFIQSGAKLFLSFLSLTPSKGNLKFIRGIYP